MSGTRRLLLAALALAVLAAARRPAQDPEALVRRGNQAFRQASRGTPSMAACCWTSRLPQKTAIEGCRLNRPNC